MRRKMMPSAPRRVLAAIVGGNARGSLARKSKRRRLKANCTGRPIIDVLREWAGFERPVGLCADEGLLVDVECARLRGNPSLSVGLGVRCCGWSEVLWLERSVVAGVRCCGWSEVLWLE